MKKELNVQIEQEALIEIRDAHDWYESQKPGLGEEFKNSLDEAFQMIMNSPNGYEKFGIHRQFPMERFPYVILYEVVNSALFIDAVFHTKRNPKDKLRN